MGIESLTETSCSELWLQWIAGWRCRSSPVSSLLHNDPCFWWVSITCVGLMRQSPHDWLKAQEICASLQISSGFLRELLHSFLLPQFCQYSVTFLSALKPCGGFVEVLGWRLLMIFHRYFFTEVLNNLSTVSGNSPTCLSCSEPTSLFFQWIGTFPVSNTSLMILWNVAGCQWQLRPCPALRAEQVGTRGFRWLKAHGKQFCLSRLCRESL